MSDIIRQQGDASQNHKRHHYALPISGVNWGAWELQWHHYALSVFGVNWDAWELQHGWGGLGGLLYNQPLDSLPSCPIPFIQPSQTMSAKRCCQK